MHLQHNSRLRGYQRHKFMLICYWCQNFLRQIKHLIQNNDTLARRFHTLFMLKNISSMDCAGALEVNFFMPLDGTLFLKNSSRKTRTCLCCQIFLPSIVKILLLGTGYNQGCCQIQSGCWDIITKKVIRIIFCKKM